MADSSSPSQMEDSVSRTQRQMEEDRVRSSSSSSSLDQNPGKKNLVEGSDDHVVVEIESSGSAAGDGGACDAAKRLEKQTCVASPSLLQSSAGGPSCSVYRIPFSLKEINRRAYDAQIVSIGPYHHGKHNLKMMEEHKFRSLGLFLDSRKGLDVKSLWEAILPVEEKIRASYSERIDLSSSELIQMMILDGVFILQILLKFNRLIPIDDQDPIFNVPWIFPFLLRDLIRLENQIPFFVLEILFDKVKPLTFEKELPSLASMAIRFFNYAMARPEGSETKWYGEFVPKHLLDLFRWTLIPKNYEKIEKGGKLGHEIELIPSSRKLWHAGITIRARKSVASFLDLRFRRGVLEIPAVTIDDFTTCLLLNCIAFEQCCSSCSMHITDYASLMHCLIATARDAEFLSQLKIVENYVGSNEEVAEFFNNVNKDVAVDVEMSTFATLFDDVNEYRRRNWWNWRVRLRAMKHAYFSKPWSVLAIWAAFALLILTAIQTFYAIRQYEYPPSIGRR